MAGRYGELDFYSAAGRANDEQEPVEWYAEFAALQPVLSRCLAFGDNLLVVGPGRSALHERLYDNGFRGLTVVDAADGVLACWRARAEAGKRAVKFERADVAAERGLEAFVHFSYNAIIDKGTLDCLLCRADGERSARTALRNMHGTLCSPGSLVIVSHSAPAERLGLLRCCEWEAIQVKVVVPPSLADLAAGHAAPTAVQDWTEGHEKDAALADVAPCYVYVCRKGY